MRFQGWVKSLFNVKHQSCNVLRTLNEHSVILFLTRLLECLLNIQQTIKDIDY